MFCGLTKNAATLSAFDFEASNGRLDETTILNSAFATPGRYVHEICKRLIRQTPNADTLVVANPLLPLQSRTLIDWFALSPAGPAAIVDRSDFPLAYALPRDVFDRGLDRFLPFLSMTDADADRRLVRMLVGTPVTSATIDIPAVAIDDTFAGTGAFACYRDRVWAWTEQCRCAVRTMERVPGWRDLPATFYLPYFAGDVLFAGLASRHVSTPLYRKIMVRDCYQDIWEQSGSSMEMVPIPSLTAGTDGTMPTEGEMFVAQARAGGNDAGRLVGYGRASRYYDRSPFHLIDQARFALGDSVLSADDLFYRKAPRPLHRCPRPVTPKRVLLCLQGSWALKRYPARNRSVLIRALRALGIDVSVLNLDEAGADGATVLHSRSTAQLRAALDDHHVFVCADTFDLHFARHVVGHPTVALFGSTWPGNSDSLHRAESRVLCGPLACTPCSATEFCALTRGHECRNYPPPHEVVAAILDMFDDLYPG